MKKLWTALACTAVALGGAVTLAPTATASGGYCGVSQSDYTLQTMCRAAAPGTEFRMISRCSDGLRYSRWATQGNWDSITMNCHGIRFVDIQFR